MAEVRRTEKRQPVLQQARAAHREHFLGHQAHGVEATPNAAAVAHRHVDAITAKVDHVIGGRDVDVDVGAEGAEAPKARYQPVGGKRCQGADGERPASVPGLEPSGGLGEDIKGVAHRREIGLTLVGQQQRPVETAEELEPQVRLQALDLMTDRRLGDVQFLGGAGERKMARRGLEDAERIKGRQTAGHRQTSYLDKIV